MGAYVTMTALADEKNENTINDSVTRNGFSLSAGINTRVVHETKSVGYGLRLSTDVDNIEKSDDDRGDVNIVNNGINLQSTMDRGMQTMIHESDHVSTEIFRVGNESDLRNEFKGYF